LYYLSSHGWLEKTYAQSAHEGSWIDRHKVPLSEFLHCIGDGLHCLIQTRSGNRQWVDGSPENLLVGETLLAMFARAHIVHVVRDPISVCMSMLTSGFAETWASDLDEAIRTWNHYAREGTRLEAKFPERVTRIRQEDMQASPHAVASAISGRLSIEDGAPIAHFLQRARINSSRDRSSYIDGSPLKTAVETDLDPREFIITHSGRIRNHTAELGARCGYG
jgi:hypothetical protein